MTLKNMWSLPAGEVICADLIKKNLGRDYEVFIPLNNQLKDFDLLVINKKNKKVNTIQVKESREYDVGEANGWFEVSSNKVKNEVADIYMFLIYTAQEYKNKRRMECRVLIVPSNVLLKKSEKKKIGKDNNYTYDFKIGEKEAFENRDNKKDPIDYSKYIHNFNLIRKAN